MKKNVAWIRMFKGSRKGKVFIDEPVQPNLKLFKTTYCDLGEHRGLDSALKSALKRVSELIKESVENAGLWAIESYEYQIYDYASKSINGRGCMELSLHVLIYEVNN